MYKEPAEPGHMPRASWRIRRVRWSSKLLTASMGSPVKWHLAISSDLILIRKCLGFLGDPELQYLQIQVALGISVPKPTRQMQCPGPGHRILED